MLKRIFTILILLCAGLELGAQTPNYYSFSSSTSTFTPLTGGTRLAIARDSAGSGASLDDTVFSLPASTIPFSFSYNGTNYTSLYVSTNGFITFGSAPSTTNTTPLSNTATYAGAISALGRDLNGHYTSTDTGQIWYGTEGSSPNRVFIVEYRNFKNYNTNRNNIYKWTFQIRLGEDKSVQFSYKYDSTGTPSSTAVTAQVGLRGPSNAFTPNVRNRLITNGTHTWTTSAVGTANSSTVSITPGNRFPTGLLWTFTPPAACTGTPTAGSVTGTSSVCAGLPVSLSVTNSPFAMNLTYQWQVSPDNTNWTNITGATDSVYTTTPNFSTRYFRRVTTCTNSSQNDATSGYAVTATSTGSMNYRSLPYLVNFENAWSSICATNDNPDSAVRITPVTGNNSWRRDNDTISASWTSATSGAYTVGRGANGTSRSARFHSWAATSGSIGTMNFLFNASANTNKVGASFYYVNTGGSDSLKLYLSTDSGQTYTYLGGIGTASNWTKYTVNLGSITPAKAILRFDAKSDAGASDIGLDEVNIYMIPRHDLSAVSVLSPAASACSNSTGATYGITRYTNVGTDTIYFASNNLTTRFVLSGAATGNYSRTRTTGFLAPNGTLDDTVTSSISLPGSGTVTIRGWGTLSGDNNAINDTTTVYTYIAYNKNSLPFVESFESVVGWTVQQVAGTGNWSVLTGSMANPTLAPRTGNKMAYFNSYSFSTGTASRLISPCIDLRGSGVPYLEFYISQSSNYSTAFDSVYVQISTDGGATWGAPIYGTGRYNASATTPGWARHRICLSAYNNEQNVKIALLGIGKYGDNIGIEDFAIRKSNGNNSITARRNAVCSGDDDTITVSATDPLLSYALFQGNTQIGSSSYGNGGNLNFALSNLTSTLGYKIKVTDDSLGCSGFLGDTVRIVVNSLPQPNLGRDTGRCQGTSHVLDAGPGYSRYDWSTLDSTQTITVNSTSSYRVVVTDSNGCRGADTILFTSFTNPAPDLGPDTSICPGNVLNLDAGAGMAVYMWSNASNSRTVSISNPGSYFVMVTDSNGCNGFDQVVIGLRPAPNVNLGRDTTFCSGNVYTLDAGPGNVKYDWSNSDTTQTTDIASGGTVSVLVTNSFGCTAYDEVVVTVNPTPGVNLGVDKAFCFGDSLILDAGTDGNIYNWSTNDTSRKITVKGSGNYSVTVENSFGCVGSDMITLQVNSLPYVFLGYDTAICNGDSMLISGPNDMAYYQWNTNDSVQGIVVSIAGTYSVKAVDVNGCISHDTITINVNPRPVVNIFGNDTTICKGSTALFDAGPGYSSYNWSNGPTTRTITPGAKGTYFVIVTNSFGCPQVDSVKLAIDSVSKNQASFTIATIGNRHFKFTPVVSTGLSYSYRFGDGNTSNIDTPSHQYSSPGLYTICMTATNTRGCFDSTCQTINVTATGKLPKSAQSVSAYPNPFNTGFTLALELNAEAKISIVLYDMLGREFVIAASELAQQGQYLKQINTNNMNLAPGMYTLKVNINGQDTYIKLNKTE